MTGGSDSDMTRTCSLSRLPRVCSRLSPGRARAWARAALARPTRRAAELTVAAPAAAAADSPGPARVSR